MVILYCLLEIVALVLAIASIYVTIKGASNNKYKKMFFIAIGLAVIVFILACLEINMEMRVDAGIHIILCLVDIFIGLVSFCKMRK